jgi:hypothetical protein
MQLFLRKDGVLRASWAEFSVLTLKKNRLEVELRTEESATYLQTSEDHK